MQLIYLYVEKYKNIQQEGFNFSQQFKCNYNYGKLTLERNSDYIENFFGENINVSLLIGKNGSGKSTLLEIISILRLELNHLFEIEGREKDSIDIILVYEKKGVLYPITGVDNHSFSLLGHSLIKNNTNFELCDKPNVSANDLFQMSIFTNGLPDFTYQDDYYLSMRNGVKYDHFYNGLPFQYKNPNEQIKAYEQSLKYASILSDDMNFFQSLKGHPLEL